METHSTKSGGSSARHAGRSRGSKPRETSGAKPREGSGTKPGEGSGAKPREGSGAKPGEGSGTKPREGSGAKPEEARGATPAERNEAGAAPSEGAQSSFVAPRDTLTVSQEAREDAGKGNPELSSLLEQLQTSLGSTGTQPQTQAPAPPGPATPPSLEAIQRANAEANRTGDMSQLNATDTYRSGLIPSEQTAYDADLQNLRGNQNVTFNSMDGSTITEADKDRVYRGIMAASFGRPEHREAALANGLRVGVTQSQDAGPEMAGDQAGVGGRGSMNLSLPATNDWYSQGHNVAAHEFIHVMQQTNGSTNLPGGPDPAQELKFNNLFESRKGVDEAERDVGHYYTEAYHWLTAHPQTLQQKSEPLYDFMTRYNNFDPLKGSRLQVP